jgi:topoisomerase IA-like protein
MGDQFISIPKGEDLFEIDIERAKQLIEEKIRQMHLLDFLMNCP